VFDCGDMSVVGWRPHGAEQRRARAIVAGRPEAILRRGDLPGQGGDGPREPRELGGVAMIGLDAVTGSAWRERGRDDRGLDPRAVSWR
jgi:hypothetical protein